MLSRDLFQKRFGARAVFGMVHLQPLPGSPMFAGDLDRVIEAALHDAKAIVNGGADGLVVENFGDRPFFKAGVPVKTIAAMTRVVAEIAREVRTPIGVNVLRNDARAAMAIAVATGAAFIRVNVHTGAMVTDQGIIEGDAATTMRERSPDVAVFADYMVKHAVPLAAADPVQAAKDLRFRGLADAIIVTGAATGAAADPAQLAMLRTIVDAPLIVGSGLTDMNAASFVEADAAIVGTAIKATLDSPVDRTRVERIVKAFKR
jgi:membrane complex biogenesis BtpA family protein